METQPPQTVSSNRLRKNRMSGANCPITDFCPITGELPCIQLINYVQTVDKCAIFTKKNNLRYFIDFTLFRLIFRFFFAMSRIELSKIQICYKTRACL